MTFKIPNIAWTIGHSFNLFLGLHAPGWLYVLGIPPRGDLPLWTPRARATDLGQGPNLRAGSGRAPCVPRSREHEKRPATGREQMPKCQKNTFIHSNTRFSPPACVSREIPGVTQADKGHTGNSSSHSLLMLGKTWSQEQQDRSSYWLLLLIFALNICYLFLAFVSEAFLDWRKRWIDQSVLPKKIAVNVNFLLR